MDVTKIVAPSVYHMFSLYLVEHRPHFGFVDIILVLILPVSGKVVIAYFYFSFMVY